MKLLGNTNLTILDLPGELQFTIQAEEGWLSRLIIALVCTPLSVWAWQTRSFVFLAFIGLALPWSIANFRSQRTTGLRVSKDGLSVSEIVRRLFSYGNTPRELRFHPFKRLEYFVGGEDEPAGLSINGTTLLLTIDRANTEVILDAIRRKFPLLENPDHSPTSLLHGDSSGITTLGLSNREWPNAPPIRPEL